MNFARGTYGDRPAHWVMLRMGGGGGGPSGSTTSTQTNSPWAGQQPFLNGQNVPMNPVPITGDPNPSTVGGMAMAQGVLPSAAELYNDYTPQYYGSSTVSPFTGAQSSALGTLSDPSLSQPVSSAATNYSTNLLGGGFLGNNPGNAGLSQYTNGSMLNNTAPQTQAAIQQAVSQATPGLMDTFTQGNRLNSPWAANAVSQGITSAAAPYVLQAQQQGQANQIGAATAQGSLYNQGVGAMNQGLAVAPNTATLPYAGAQTQYNAGTAQQGQNQAQLNDLINRFNFGQQLPYNKLATYQQMVQGNYGGTGTLSQPYFSQSGGDQTGSQIMQGVAAVAPLIAAAFI